MADVYPAVPDHQTERGSNGTTGITLAPLARLEAAVALTKVTARFPAAQLAGEPQYKPNLTLRGMASLEVAV